MPATSTSTASMTTFMTRPPLQPLENSNLMSGHGRGNDGGRRQSARLAEKEDIVPVKGMGSGVDSTMTATKTEATGSQTGKRSAGDTKTRTGSKRKQAYDEEDNGFAFTRTRAKKAKAPIATSKEEPSHPPTAPAGDKPDTTIVAKKKPRKKSFNSPVAAPSTQLQEQAPPPQRRKSTKPSDEPHQEAEPPVLTVKKKRKSRDGQEKQTQATPGKASQQQEQAQPERATQHASDPIPQKQPEVEAKDAETSFDATKIALPFADTPIIRRNKEMRKGGSQTGSRRSSLGLRGRRASSLIDAGKSNALPHHEVETLEFYKHIESEGLSEPRRMRQLLMWCGARALGEKPSFNSEDGNARLAAREIQSELLKEFSSRSDLSDWFGRDDSATPVTTPKPNPNNLSNMAKIKELERRIATAQKESQAWQALLRPPSETSLQLEASSHPNSKPTTSIPGPSSPTKSERPLPKLSNPTSVEDSTSSNPLSRTVSQRLHKIHSGLEFEVDKFTHEIHALSSYQSVAERVADEVLALSAQVLERRDREGRMIAAQGREDREGAAERTTRRRGASVEAEGGKGEMGKNGGDGGVTTTTVQMRDLLRTLSRVIDR